MEEEYVFNYNLNDENILWSDKQDRLVVLFKNLWIDIAFSIIVFALCSIYFDIVKSAIIAMFFLVGHLFVNRNVILGNPTTLQHITYDLSYKYIITDAAIHIYCRGGHSCKEYKSFDYIVLSRGIFDKILGTATIKIMTRKQEERSSESFDSAYMFKMNRDKTCAKLLHIRDYKYAADIIRKQKSKY